MFRSGKVLGSSAKILILITTWPSKEHPYLVHLFGALRRKFPNLQFLIFNKPDNVLFAEQLIGKQALSAVLSRAFYRWSLSLKSWKILAPAVAVVWHPIATIRTFCRLREMGYPLRKSFGQILFFHALIGKKFDLVYINALQTALHISLPAFFKQTPVIVSSRGQDFDLHPAKFDNILRQVDHVHVLGDYLERLVLLRGVNQDKITKIPPAVLPSSKSMKSKSGSKKVRVISVSRLHWIKGYSYALRAIRLVADKLGADSFEYLIVGDGPEKDEILVEVDRLSLQHCVRLVGWKSQPEIDEYLFESDIFLLLSIGEGFNNAAMQAQQLGVPCVVSDAGGLPENVAHRHTGIVVARYNAQAAADALIELIINRDMRVQMGHQAQVRMIADFNLDKQVERYTKLFEDNL